MVKTIDAKRSTESEFDLPLFANKMNNVRIYFIVFEHALT